MAAIWTQIDSISVQSVQAGTESAPTLSSEGMPLEAVMAVTIWLDAGVGQTITSDAGQVDTWVYDAGQWGVAPSLVFSVPPGSSGQRRVLLGTEPIDNQRGRLAPICNGVTVSGATATLDILVTIDRRGISRAA